MTESDKAIDYELLMRGFRSFIPNARIIERLNTLIEQERYYEAEGWNMAMKEVDGKSLFERWEYAVKKGYEPL